MNKKFYDVGTHNTRGYDYSSFASFEAGIQGAGYDVANIAVLGLSKQNKDEFEDFIRNKFYGSLSTNLLVITEAGDVLARYLDALWIVTFDSLEKIFNRQPISILAVRAIADDFLGTIEKTQEEGEISSEVKSIVREASEKLALLIAKNPFALHSIEWRELEKNNGRSL